MSKLDLSNLDTIIENLKTSMENIKSILEEQDLTLFHTKDYYEGELNVYRDVILMLKLYQEHQKNWEDTSVDKELEEAINRLSNFKTIKVLYGNTFAIHLEQLEQLQKNITTLLNYIENSIPTSVVEEKINEYKKIAEKADKISETVKEERLDGSIVYSQRFNADGYIAEIIVKILQELLQEKERNNVKNKR